MNKSLVQQNKGKPVNSNTTVGDAWDTGEWGSFDESPPTGSARVVESQTRQMTTDDGWGEDEWGSGDWQQDKKSKAELAKKKREERRQKLQAQKDKRAAGVKGPMKLGAVKMQ